jgi:hypothetical protein
MAATTLTIKRFDYSDIGAYTCVADNGSGEPLSQSITLKRACIKSKTFSVALQSHFKVFHY